MCGRYRLSRPERLEETFETEPFEDLPPRYNIAPTQPVATVRQVGSSRILSIMRWVGFQRFVVGRIVPESPAAEAGIVQGDIIESIDTSSAEKVTLTEIRSMLCQS